MDRYKFRGKRLDNGEWVISDSILCNDDGEIYLGERIKYDFGVHDTTWHLVDPSTVGQFTGLRDKTRTEKYPKGKPIYEDDIVKQTYEKDVRDDDNCWYTTSGNHVGVATVDKRNGVCIKNPIRYTEEDGVTIKQKGLIKTLASYRTEVIGNIHDNPELLKGE